MSFQYHGNFLQIEKHFCAKFIFLEEITTQIVDASKSRSSKNLLQINYFPKCQCVNNQVCETKFELTINSGLIENLVYPGFFFLAVGSLTHLQMTIQLNGRERQDDT